MTLFMQWTSISLRRYITRYLPTHGVNYDSEAEASGEDVDGEGGGTIVDADEFAGDTSPFAAFSACFSLTMIRIRMPSCPSSSGFVFKT